MRLIDADAIKIPSTWVDMFENCRNCKLLDEEQVREIIDSAPTIKINEGEWVELSPSSGGYYKCSSCNTPTEAFGAIKIYPFCPFCGARMKNVEPLPYMKWLKGADDE